MKHTNASGWTTSLSICSSRRSSTTSGLDVPRWVCWMARRLRPSWPPYRQGELPHQALQLPHDRAERRGFRLVYVLGHCPGMRMRRRREVKGERPAGTSAALEGRGEGMGTRSSSHSVRPSPSSSEHLYVPPAYSPANVLQTLFPQEQPPSLVLTVLHRAVTRHTEPQCLLSCTSLSCGPSEVDKTKPR